MERLSRLLDLIPEYVAAGLLDAAGGNLAVRSDKGIYVTPSQAGEELRWRLTEDDFVLFPGGGEASMARAGRRPSRENRLHRALLGARQDWNCSYLGYPWGALAFALAKRPLSLPESHSRMINRHKAVQVPVLPEMSSMVQELAGLCSEAAQREFRDCEHGALLLGGLGLVVAGPEPESVLALAQIIECCGRAQAWSLTHPA